MIPTGLVLLNDKYLEIARMLLKGHSQVSIAEAMGMSPHSISTIINKNTLFKRAMSELQYLATQEAFDLKAFMEAHTRDAAQVIVDAMKDDSTPLYVRRQAAKDVIGLAGHRNANAPTTHTNIAVLNQREPEAFETMVKHVEALDTPQDEVSADA